MANGYDAQWKRPKQAGQKTSTGMQGLQEILGIAEGIAGHIQKKRDKREAFNIKYISTLTSDVDTEFNNERLQDTLRDLSQYKVKNDKNWSLETIDYYNLQKKEIDKQIAFNDDYTQSYNKLGILAEEADTILDTVYDMQINPGEHGDANQVSLKKTEMMDKLNEIVVKYGELKESWGEKHVDRISQATADKMGSMQQVLNESINFFADDGMYSEVEYNVLNDAAKRNNYRPLKEHIIGLAEQKRTDINLLNSELSEMEKEYNSQVDMIEAGEGDDGYRVPVENIPEKFQLHEDFAAMQNYFTSLNQFESFDFKLDEETINTLLNSDDPEARLRGEISEHFRTQVYDKKSDQLKFLNQRNQLLYNKTGKNYLEDIGWDKDEGGFYYKSGLEIESDLDLGGFKVEGALGEDIKDPQLIDNQENKIPKEVIGYATVSIDNIGAAAGNVKIDRLDSQGGDFYQDYPKHHNSFSLPASKGDDDLRLGKYSKMINGLNFETVSHSDWDSTDIKATGAKSPRKFSYSTSVDYESNPHYVGSFGRDEVRSSEESFPVPLVPGSSDASKEIMDRALEAFHKGNMKEARTLMGEAFELDRRVYLKAETSIDPEKVAKEKEAAKTPFDRVGEKYPAAAEFIDIYRLNPTNIIKSSSKHGDIDELWNDSKFLELMENGRFNSAKQFAKSKGIILGVDFVEDFEKMTYGYDSGELVYNPHGKAEEFINYFKELLELQKK